MLDDVSLRHALTAAAETERVVRHHRETAREGANEAACSKAAYRNAVGLRKALEDWVSVREWHAKQQRMVAQ